MIKSFSFLGDDPYKSPRIYIISVSDRVFFVCVQSFMVGWPYIDIFFLDSFLFIKTCNFEPFCYEIKSVLLRREPK